MKIPIVADFSKKVATDYGVLLPGGVPLRALFIIDPKGTLRYVTWLMKSQFFSSIHTQNVYVSLLLMLHYDQTNNSQRSPRGPQRGRDHPPDQGIPVRGGARRGVPRQLASRGHHHERRSSAIQEILQRFEYCLTYTHTYTYVNMNLHSFKYTYIYTYVQV